MAQSAHNRVVNISTTGAPIESVIFEYKQQSNRVKKSCRISAQVFVSLCSTRVCVPSTFFRGSPHYIADGHGTNLIRYIARNHCSAEVTAQGGLAELLLSGEQTETSVVLTQRT